MTDPASPRIPPITPAERDEDTDQLLDMVGDFRNNNIFLTLVRHPRAYKRLVPWGTVMLFGTIPPRDRELLILRTAHRCGCSYEWVHHVEISGERGVDPSEIEAIREGPDAAHWSEFDAALLRAVDECHDGARISDQTWKVIAERYEQSQMMELPMLIGHYHLMAFILNSLGVELEPDYL